MKTFEKIVASITALIEQYTTQSSGMTIDQILDLKDKLAGYSFFFADSVASQKLDYNKKWFVRSISVLAEKNKLKQMDTKLSNVALEDLAKDATKEKLKEQIDSEAQAFRGEVLLRQVNKIIDSMEQRVSHLKNERNLTSRQ